MEIGRRNERKHRMHGRAIRMEHFHRPEASSSRSCRSALHCNEYVTVKKKDKQSSHAVWFSRKCIDSDLPGCFNRFSRILKFLPGFTRHCYIAIINQCGHLNLDGVRPSKYSHLLERKKSSTLFVSHNLSDGRVNFLYATVFT